ncbi:MAG: hypothetical protein E6377_18530 [Clostridium sp.]|uniref:hypothetical protein n=1 Tax=Clostridium TaxID=1485 RepID=UPI00206328B8|nr:MULTISPECIES: hypothetical protein [Clostridium]DAU44842.1 MAG TPA: hypothetical protein [Caudoviricetes sp.]MBS7132930.1 hypothetical protein [Clostridium sp.]MDB2121174.1 hypothetical protein [Clostridium paraputrificum]MDU2108915.1 hypothetical protein [Clostridium sp.]MDU3355987.1 hypothetical protein [Clostridium sp.]
MENNIQIGGLYKIKSDKKLCELEERLTPYVRFLGYALNPLKKDDYYIEFIYVYKDDLEPTTRIHPIKILPYDIFFEYFQLELTTQEVNKILFKSKNN